VTKKRGGRGAVRAAWSSGAISANGSGRFTAPSYKGTEEKILLERKREARPSSPSRKSLSSSS
jgi:hypothetical protein